MPSNGAKTGIFKQRCFTYNEGRWRGAGVVERARLENENSRKAIEGSNPSLSAVGKHNACLFYFLCPDIGRLERIRSDG